MRFSAQTLIVSSKQLGLIESVFHFICSKLKKQNSLFARTNIFPSNFFLPFNREFLEALENNYANKY